MTHAKFRNRVAINPVPPPGAAEIAAARHYFRRVPRELAAFWKHFNGGEWNYSIDVEVEGDVRTLGFSGLFCLSFGSPETREGRTSVLGDTYHYDGDPQLIPVAETGGGDELWVSPNTGNVFAYVIPRPGWPGRAEGGLVKVANGIFDFMDRSKLRRATAERLTAAALRLSDAERAIDAAAVLKTGGLEFVDLLADLKASGLLTSNI